MREVVAAAEGPIDTEGLTALKRWLVCTSRPSAESPTGPTNLPDSTAERALNQAFDAHSTVGSTERSWR